MLYKQQSFSNFEPDLRYLDSFPFSREEFLFFDIETTGFSPRNTSLYLIGAVCFLDEHWTFLQWFAETPSEECEILNAFLAFCRSFRAVVHFNGDGFDIPYLLFKAEKYTLSDTLSSMQSIDLYRLTRPYKKYLKLTHINQKSLESFLGIEREDRYNGGELIKIYQSYCQLKDADALSLLLLHNLDDLKGMTKLLPLLAYPLFLKDQDYTLRNLFWEDSVNGQPLLIAELDLKYPVPKQISNRLSSCYLTLQEGTAKLMIYAFEGISYLTIKIIIIFLCRTVLFISTLPLISIHVNASLQKPQPVTSVTGDFFFLRKKHCSNLFSRKAIIRILSGLNVRNSL